MVIAMDAALSFEELLKSGHIMPVDENNKPFIIRHHVKFFDENLSYQKEDGNLSFNKLPISRISEMDKNLNDVSPNLKKAIISELMKYIDSYYKVFYILEARHGLFHGDVSNVVYYYIKGIKR